MKLDKLAALACICIVSASCSALSRCSRRRSQEVVHVRWPVSVASTPATTLDAESKSSFHDEILPQNRPGVQVRRGRAVDLDYLEVVLGDAQFDDPLPLVVLLHGRGDRPRVPGGPFGAIPTAVRVVLPRGPRPLGQGYSWLPVSITQGKIDVLTQALGKRAHHLAAFIDWIRQNRPTLGRPIVSGFSQGGMLTFTLAALRPDLVTAAFPMAGWLPPGLMPKTGPREPDLVRIRAAHGTADRIVPFEPTREVVARLQSLGWDVALEVFEGVEHVVDKRMNAAFEAWLEEAVRAQAPALAGGLGHEGPEEEEYEAVEPLEEETIQLMLEEEEATEQAQDAQSNDVLESEAGGSAGDATEAAATPLQPDAPPPEPTAPAPEGAPSTPDDNAQPAPMP